MRGEDPVARTRGRRYGRGRGDHGTGNPILCIHGTGSSALLWGDAVPELARRGRVILYDRRDCTRSERPDPYETTTAAEHADDSAALAQALSATPAVVIGRRVAGDTNGGGADVFVRDARPPF